MTAFDTVSASKLDFPSAEALSTVETASGTADAGENVRREMGPPCSLDAAVIAESVWGASEESAVGSAMTRVEFARQVDARERRSSGVRWRMESMMIVGSEVSIKIYKHFSKKLLRCRGLMMEFLERFEWLPFCLDILNKLMVTALRCV